MAKENEPMFMAHSCSHAMTKTPKNTKRYARSVPDSVKKCSKRTTTSLNHSRWRKSVETSKLGAPNPMFGSNPESFGRC